MTKRQLRTSIVGIVACIVTAACSSVQSGLPADVTGTWSGSWQSGWGNKGPVVLTLQQAGQKVTGQLESTAFYSGGPVDGDVRGHSVYLKSSGTFPPLQLEMDGDQMTGSFPSSGGGVNSIALRRQR